MHLRFGQLLVYRKTFQASRNCAKAASAANEGLRILGVCD